jgi:DNA invertase Pin-like site-specific DNA recombinase
VEVAPQAAAVARTAAWAKATMRPPAMTAQQIRHARDLLTRPDNTVSSIARLLGVSRATIYKYVPEVTTGRQAAAALPPGQEDAI